MDILTQGLLGGVLAQSFATNDEKKLASVVGAIAGLLADLDFLIYSPNDPLLNIEYHRHFSHSLVFIPFGAAIALLLFWPFLRRRLTVRRLYIFCLAGYSMSGILDACTSYGTHLFWPFTDDRIALHIIAIIDPIFTLILLITFILGLRFQAKYITYSGLLLAITYMSLGFIQQQRAQQIVESLIAARSHTASKLIIKPTLGNILLWRSVYIHKQRIYVDAIRVSFLSDTEVFEGESVELFTLDKDLPDLDVSSVLYDDIRRFMVFSEGFVAYDISQKNVLGDIRYSMLPISTKPVWGIMIDTDNIQRHADYQFFRENSEKIRKTFINMLSGRCAKINC